MTTMEVMHWSCYEKPRDHVKASLNMPRKCFVEIRLMYAWCDMFGFLTCNLCVAYLIHDILCETAQVAAQVVNLFWIGQ